MAAVKTVGIETPKCAAISLHFKPLFLMSYFSFCLFLASRPWFLGVCVFIVFLKGSPLATFVQLISSISPVKRFAENGHLPNGVLLRVEVFQHEVDRVVEVVSYNNRDAGHCKVKVTSNLAVAQPSAVGL